MNEQPPPPKLFISYSWSTPEHEQWVIDLATELRESGVDVILDKWDLKEGNDSVAFMEQMVTDPKISKVAVISDKFYAEKADGRAGGVGTETQIISREVYENQSQEKFVAILPCKDEQGKAYLPTYYKGRIYIDLSESEKYTENFEKLLRWIFNKPLLIKPEIGSKPAFLAESEHISLGTTASWRRCIDAIKTSKPYATGALDEYLSLFSKNIENFRIERTEHTEQDELIIENIEHFLPYRNELIQLFISIAQYAPTEENAKRIHRFLESLIPYMHRPENITQWNRWDFDNFKFIIHEIFLYAVGIFIKHDRFELANELLRTPYFVLGRSDYGKDAAVSFSAFREYTESFEHRNKRLNLRRLSVRADILKERNKHSGIDFSALMQTDFILFMRASQENERWWPETLIYSAHSYGAFEVWARSISRNYFERAKILIAVDTKEELDVLLSSFKEDRQKLPRWDWDSFDPAILIGQDKLCTKP
ncbi:TIR domain-containing protein [Pseudomonas sp. CCNWLW56]|uniref:TIR domain-containing protein n=1 Tax=unclassified Pseudomonas TaxID=196821 RepID=UPI003076C7CC